MRTLAELDTEVSRYLAGPGDFPDPYPLLAELREAGPVLRTSAGPWVVSGYEEAEAVLKNPAFGRAGAAQVEADAIRGEDGTGAKASDIWMRMFLNMDTPDHTRLRRRAAPAFRASMMSHFRGLVSETVNQLVEEMLLNRNVDFISQFAYPLPRTVICRTLGVPEEDDELWNAWVYTIANVNRAKFKDDEPGSMRDALVSLGQYCESMLHLRWNNPSEDLIGVLIESATHEGDITHDELAANLLLLIVAGHETTVNLLGNGMSLLMSNPDQWKLLQQNPDLAPRVVEEAIRLEPPARVSVRIATTPLELAGQRIEKGERVIILVPAVNRDPRRFQDPDAFKLVEDRAASMSFGHGAHFCLGAPLARLEGELAFRRLASVDIHLREAPEWRNAAHRALHSLELEVSR